jgi:hypothetical protein
VNTTEWPMWALAWPIGAYRLSDFADLSWCCNE